MRPRLLPTLVALLVAALGCSGVEQRPPSELESLRAQLGLPEETPRGRVEVFDGKAWLAVPFGETLVPLAPADSPPSGAEAAALPEAASRWLLFDASPPVALQLSDSAWLWSLSEPGNELRRWIALVNPRGERVPFEVVDEPERHGDAVYRIDLDPGRAGSEWITIGRRTLEIESTQAGRLLFHYVPFENAASGRLSRMYRTSDGAIQLLVEYEWHDDGSGVEHSWQGEYLLRWDAIATEVTELRVTDHRSDWVDHSWDYWDVSDIDFDRRPVVAQPGHPCFRSRDTEAEVVGVDRDRLRIPAIETDLLQPTAHMLGESTDRRSVTERYDVPGGTIERSVIHADLEWTWFDEQSHCGEHITGQFRAVEWTFVPTTAQPLTVWSLQEGRAQRTPIVFWSVAP